MNEIEIRTKALEAIGYVLARIQTSADFAYHMVGSQTFQRLCEAFVLLEGKDTDAKLLAAELAKPLYQGRPREEELAERLEAADAQLDWYRRFVSREERERCEREVRDAAA